MALAAAALLLAPAAASAASHVAVLAPVHVPFALFGISVKGVVKGIIKAVVGFFVPSFAHGWATHVVTWFVAVPNVSDARAYATLNGFRRDLAGVGFGLVSLSVVLACVQYLAAGVYESGPFRAISTFAHALTAIGMLAFGSRLVSLAITGTNLLTASMIRHPSVSAGIDDLIGGALALGVITSGLSLGVAAGAAITACYFLAALFIFKIGDTALLAVLQISGVLVWGLYPLRSAAWLARTWLAALFAVLLIPIAWACVFAAAGLLGRDGLLWQDPAVPGNGLTDAHTFRLPGTFS